MIALIDVLDDHPFDITRIFDSLLNDSCIKQPLYRVDGLTSKIIIPPDTKGIIISGSVHHIYDVKGKNWKDALCELVRNHYMRIPFLGICFGHQTIAYALGGEVVPNILGREIGTVPIYTTIEAKGDLLFSKFESGSLVSQSHFDHVTRLPKGAVRLAYNNHSPNQAFRVGNSWGIQFHPELQPMLFGHLLSGRIKKLQEKGEIVESIKLQNTLESIRECPQALEILKRFISLCSTNQ